MKFKSKCNTCNHIKNDQTIIEALQQVMRDDGYITQRAMFEIADRLKKPISEIYGVATFYTQFIIKPKAQYTIEVCTGTACFVLGAEKILDAVKQKLKIDLNEITNNQKFSLNEVRCLGCCGIAPVVRINNKIFQKATPKMICDEIDKLNKDLK